MSCFDAAVGFFFFFFFPFLSAIITWILFIDVCIVELLLKLQMTQFATG